MDPSAGGTLVASAWVKRATKVASLGCSRYSPFALQSMLMSSTMKFDLPLSAGFE
jgi:hypothetical protein